MSVFLFESNLNAQWQKSITSKVFNLTEGSSFLRRFILRAFFSAGTNFCGLWSIRKIRKNKNPQNFHATR